MSTQTRTYRYNTYRTQGNLALAHRHDLEFELIEGGASASKKDRHETASRASEVQAFRNFLIASVVFFSLVFALMGASIASDMILTSRISAIDNVATTCITVKQGDCLLDIADDHPVAGRSSEEVVSWIKDANGLDNATIMVGQRLIVPSNGR